MSCQQKFENLIHKVRSNLCIKSSTTKTQKVRSNWIDVRLIEVAIDSIFYLKPTYLIKHRFYPTYLKHTLHNFQCETDCFFEYFGERF